MYPYKMAESISMVVKGDVPKGLLAQVCVDINPEYVGDLLAKNGISIVPEMLENVTSSYGSFPTEDLALQVLSTDDGMKFWGIASGSSYRYERVAAKYLILLDIQERLLDLGISSEINIADLNPETIEFMSSIRAFSEKLPELKEIAEREGSLEDAVIGIVGAYNTPAL